MNNNLLNKLKVFLEAKDVSVQTYDGLGSGVMLNGPANVQEINNVSAGFDFQLPADFVSFLKVVDGGVFFQVEDFAGYKFFDCEELIRQNRFQRKSYGVEWDHRIVLICLCLGDGDFVGIKVLDENTYEMMDCYLDQSPREWESINYLFDDFLYRLIEAKGRKFWVF